MASPAVVAPSPLHGVASHYWLKNAWLGSHGRVVVKSLSSGLPDPRKVWQAQQMISPNCCDWCTSDIKLYSGVQSFRQIGRNLVHPRVVRMQKICIVIHFKQKLCCLMPSLIKDKTLIDKPALQFCFSQILLYYPTLVVSDDTKMLLSPGASCLCHPRPSHNLS